MATMAPVHKHAQGALISRSGGHTSPNGVFLEITKMLPAASCSYLFFFPSVTISTLLSCCDEVRGCVEIITLPL